ncbi:MAG: hypothetical protein K0S74_1676 [Chlamydiales bacterium]|jgi:lipoate-protein ligase A|nr:hypothetical protein [Chlamydiales bacterium]
MWNILDTGTASARENMALDIKLLQNLSPSDDPILHLYDWANPSATIGHFIKPEDFLNMDQLDELKLDIARRPTGGGIIFHLCDFAFSILIPSQHPFFSLNTLQNYITINEQIIQIIKPLLSKIGEPQLLEFSPVAQDSASNRFCLANPTIYDIVINGRKIGGAAQRKTKVGLLHQGSITVALPAISFLEKVLKSGTHVLSSMQTNSLSLLGPNSNDTDLKYMRASIKTKFISHFSC